MTTSSITLQQANTTDGSYDPKVALPKPVTVTADHGYYLGHPTNRGPELGHLVGFVSDPGSYDVRHAQGLPDDPAEVVGMFLVVEEGGGFYADTRVIERVVSHEVDGA